MQCILVIEDDFEINQLIAKYLEKEGFRVESAYNGEDAIQLLTTNEYQLVILDMMLPKVEGKEVLRKLREEQKIPVIILSAKDSEMDKIMGLNLGADDYIIKPFTIGELVARVKAQLRRFQNFNSSTTTTTLAASNILHHGDLQLNNETYTVTVDGEAKKITSKEFAILKLFLSNPTRVFTKSQIFESVWQEESFTDDNTVMVHVNRLRAKIEKDPSKPKYIKTVWGFGYKLGEKE